MPIAGIFTYLGLLAMAVTGLNVSAESPGLWSMALLLLHVAALLTALAMVVQRVRQQDWHLPRDFRGPVFGLGAMLVGALVFAALFVMLGLVLASGGWVMAGSALAMLSLKYGTPLASAVLLLVNWGALSGNEQRTQRSQ